MGFSSFFFIKKNWYHGAACQRHYDNESIAITIKYSVCTVSLQLLRFVISRRIA